MAKLHKSVIVGYISSASTIVLILYPPEIHGIFIINGILFAISKFVCLHHCPWSPKWNPWSLYKTTIVFSFNPVSFNVLIILPICASINDIAA